MLSLRGPEFEERTDRDGKLPPIRPEEAELLFHRQEVRGDLGDSRADSRMSINSPETDSLRSANTTSHLPSIESDREDSARYSQQTVDNKCQGLSLSNIKHDITIPLYCILCCVGPTCHIILSH